MTTRTRGHRPLGIPEPWRTMVARAGGYRPLAATLGCTPYAIYCWATGRRQCSWLVMRQAINTWARRRGIESPFGDDRESPP
jgi:hypothetical protein